MDFPLCDKECNSKGILGHILFLHGIKLEKLADVNTLLSNIKGFSRISGTSGKPSIVTEAQDIDTRATRSSNCNPEIIKPQQSEPNILSYKQNVFSNNANTCDKEMFLEKASLMYVKSEPRGENAIKALEKMPWGAWPDGAEICLSCSRHFWKTEMKPGDYSADCWYCIYCYEQLRQLRARTH